MNCVELEQSLAETEDGSRTEQQAHLETCPRCLELLAELSLIASSAAQLREADEPGPRVWNSIEVALRQEGLIRPRRNRSHPVSFAARWGVARWMVPAAAALLIMVGIYARQHSSLPQRAEGNTPQAYSNAVVAGLNDDDLVQEVSDKTPASQARYQDNLRRVNEYIHDAESNVQANPEDEEAHRSLMEAYEQKAMLFDMAMDRSLP